MSRRRRHDATVLDCVDGPADGLRFTLPSTKHPEHMVLIPYRYTPTPGGRGAAHLVYASYLICAAEPSARPPKQRRHLAWDARTRLEDAPKTP